MKSKLKNSSLFLITKQLYRTFRQSMYYFLKKGDFKRAYYWFTVRNVVSLFGSKAGSNKKESYHLSAELYSEGFMELNRLTKKTVNDLTNLFLTSQEEDYKNLSDYFQNQRKKNFVRSAALNVAKNNEICQRAFKELDIIPIVKEYLGLPEKDIYFSAEIDSLVKIDGNRNLKNGYDDALEFHRDIDSFRFVKAFCYLVDIDYGYGEHEVCLRSHRSVPINLRTIERQKYSQLKDKLRDFELKSFVGPCGYSWIEDTTSFHRGTVPTKGDRLLLTFSFNDAKSSKHLYNDDSSPYFYQL